MPQVQEPLIQSATPLPETLNPQVVYSWKAPLRAYKKNNKRVLRFYMVVAFLLSVIIFFLGDRILIIPIWSILFLFYVLTITPPPMVVNKITRFGIETVGITIRWEVLSHFYFTKRFGFIVLTVVTQDPYNLHAYMIVPNEEVKRAVMRILAEHIVYQDKPRLTMTDRMIHWLSYLIPEDEEEETGEQKKPPHKREESQLENIKDTLESFFQKQKVQPPSHQAFVPIE